MIKKGILNNREKIKKPGAYMCRSPEYLPDSCKCVNNKQPKPVNICGKNQAYLSGFSVYARLF